MNKARILLSAALILGMLCLLPSCQKSPQQIPDPQPASPQTPPAETTPDDPVEDIVLEPIDEEPEPPEIAITGTLLPLGSPEFADFPQGVLASQEELEHWQALAQPGSVAAIQVCDMGDQQRELTPDAAARIVSLLTEAQLNLYDTLGNPMTGGIFQVNAQDASGAILFRAAYDGEWLTVQFGGEEESYIFDASAAGLDQLYACTAE